MCARSTESRFRSPAGRTLALVGESGCGKTTVGKAILQLVRPTGGSGSLAGTSSRDLPHRLANEHRKGLQMVFQDPFVCAQSAHAHRRHPARRHGGAEGRSRPAARHARIDELLQRVGLMRRGAQPLSA